MNVKQLFLLSSILALSTNSHGANSGADLSIFDEARQLTPNLIEGKKMYNTCKTCHQDNGWGNKGGHYPQIAGQLKDVIIKQLLDIRSGLRGNPMMAPFTSERFLPTSQSIADVSGYISQLPMTDKNGIGPGFAIEKGKKLYVKHCEDCHGKEASGEIRRQVPALRAQHYNYMTRQFNWIKNGIRKNGDKEMIKQIQEIPFTDWQSILDYTSRLPPKNSTTMD
ncbi:MAG: c-type cytochrome [Gammaproteobacteria bacterium]|nr:c-type cytochrome [Gammaproteobacteria bacterium]